MLTQILPDTIESSLHTVNLQHINEIRMRVDKPVMVSLKGKNFFLSSYGITADYASAIICDKNMIDYILAQASNNSLYTIHDQLVQGFVTVKGGVRIGIAGDVVNQDGEVKTVKNIRSLNIRIPHDVKNCSLNYYNLLVENGAVKNTLIVSPPGAGKTTFLRDFAFQLGKREMGLNLLIVDERNEISGTSEYDGGLDIGEFTDVYTNCSKLYAFENGIRSMKPDVILTDEINLFDDLVAIENAMTSGVKVVASIHASSMDELKSKSKMKELLTKKMFERFVVLSNKNGPGTLEGIYNENLVCVYC